MPLAPVTPLPTKIQLVDLDEFCRPLAGKGRSRFVEAQAPYNIDHRIFTRSKGLTMNVCDCTAGVLYNTREAVLFHVEPAGDSLLIKGARKGRSRRTRLKADRALLRQLGEVLQGDIKRLRKGNQAVQGVVFGGDQDSPVSQQYGTFISKLLTRLNVPFSMIWGRKNRGLQAHATYSVPDRTLRLNIFDLNGPSIDTSSITTLGGLKNAYHKIQLLPGHTLDERVPPLKDPSGRQGDATQIGLQKLKTRKKK